MIAKRCSKCGELKLLEMFGRDYKTIDGLKSQCRQCKAKYYNRYKKTGPGRMSIARSNTARKMKKLGLDYFTITNLDRDGGGG